MNKDIYEYIEAYGKELSRLCVSLCSGRQDAEDLYQITWEKVIKGIKGYDSTKPFDKWLWSVCVNAHRDMMKNSFRRRVLAFDKSEELEKLLSSIPDKSKDMDEYIALHNAINRLPLPKRQVIALYYFKDLSTAELSEILGIPEGTVKSRLKAARDQIRKELFDE
ncbi:MAG: RNA polymerase sigma factor [Ruminococcus sp.]